MKSDLPMSAELGDAMHKATLPNNPEYQQIDQEVKKRGQAPGIRPGLTWSQLKRMLDGDDIRSKGDLKDWTGSPSFHLSHR